MYLWEQVKKVPFEVRVANPFQLGNVCEDPERCDAFEEKGGDASQGICPECPVYKTCQQRGFLSQFTSLNKAKAQILSLPELFFNPLYNDIAEDILKQMDDMERLCIIDRTQVYNLFPKCKLSKEILEEWSVSWQGAALGNFSKSLLHAADIEDTPHEIAVKRIRTVVRAFEWQEEQLIKQMCQVNVPGKVIEQGIVDSDSEKQLAHFTIQFAGGAFAYIPIDNTAEAKLTEMELPFFRYNGSALNEDIRVLMPLVKAIQLGIFSIETVSDIEKLPTICPDSNWTYWHQLRSFFEHYMRDIDAPIRWTGNTLSFSVPPILNPNVKRLLLMSTNLSVDHLRRAFPKEKVEVRRAKPIPWVQGNKVFQIRSGLYPRKTIVEYNSNWDITGLSVTGQRLFLGIRTEIERNPDVKHAIITYKSIVSRLSDLTKMENVSFATDFNKIRGLGDALQAAQVIWIVGTPSLKQNIVWQRSQVLFGNDKEPLSYEEDTESGLYIDKRVQSVYEQSVIPLLSRIVKRVKLDQLSDKTVVLISSLKLPQITDRPETLIFDWVDFEVAGDLEKLPEVIATRERFEMERDNLSVESSREEVEQILGCSSRQANRILQKMRGGKRLRVPFREQILSLLADGDKRTSEFIDAIEGHPKAVKNELSRLVNTGEIVKIRWGLYTLP